MSIKFDFSSMLSLAIGDVGGIDFSELDNIRPLFDRTLQSLKYRYNSGDLPFFDLPFQNAQINGVATYAADARSRFENFVLLGIGGSALGPVALHSSLNHPQYNLLSTRPGCRFFCPDNVDPDLVNSVFDVVDVSHTLFNVVSKSGGTGETTAQFLIVLDLLKKRLGDEWRKHLVITTDPKNGFLRRFADEERIQTFPIDPGVGGRFSVLSPVGLLPAAMVGIDIGKLCAGAGRMRELAFKSSLEQNPAALFAALLYLSQSLRGRAIHVIFAYSNRLYPIADWFRQLWAESLGKRFDTDGAEVMTGPTPIKAIGATDQHSQVQLYLDGPNDKVVVFLGVKQFETSVVVPPSGINAPETEYLEGAELGALLNTERFATAYALANEGRPNMTLELDKIDAEHIGALLYLLEVATLYGGGFYRVNPLDQPGVEAGKKATYALMGRTGYDVLRREIETFKHASTRELLIKM